MFLLPYSHTLKIHYHTCSLTLSLVWIEKVKKFLWGIVHLLMGNTPCTSPLGVFLDLHIVIGWEEKLVVKVGSEEYQHCLGNCMMEGSYCSHRQCRISSLREAERPIPQRGDGNATAARGYKATSSGTINPLECRILMSPASSGSSPTSPSKLTGFHSFPASALTFTADILWDWELNLHCHSANGRMRAGVWFSATSAL